jgi:competence protein ComGC
MLPLPPRFMCDSTTRRFAMRLKTAQVSVVVTIFMIGLTASAWAVDMNGMKQKVETVKGQAENVKKEGGETTQSVKDMKAQDAMKNAGEAKNEGKKLKDAVMGK